ncbi:MAG: GTP cyclohydrolase I FolE2 [Candidatus Sericytochromatia bacterium]|uniref:GTP cyclohydrolase FolE2 n=1 Tax=Candidatus Tanganyikabacteria bacterium TaxID=2961651 RepID=A0A938BN23_9BACT|nr:GTP cyclohydrolase I FolE2 [Candidatus Tanganyikabacteria bacterium]
MHDIQDSPDTRCVALQRVGIKDISVPMRVQTRSGSFQTVHATCELTVGLPKEFKGTHMSRFVEILAHWQKRNLSGSCVEDLVDDVCTRLGASTAAAAIRFKYFVEKAAPASGLVAATDLDCSFEGEVGLDGIYHFTLGLAVPMTTLCPCSKAISRYGAHNQRSLVVAKVRYRTGCIWIEDLASALEDCGSCPIYPLLKREDEKVVTERAFDNPKFVEDVLRDAILYLRSLPGIEWFSLECTNFESIHNHNAFAAHEEWVETFPGPV